MSASNCRRTPFNTEKNGASIPSWSACMGLFLLGAVATLGWSPLGQAWIAWLAFGALVAHLAKVSGASKTLVHCLCFALGFHAAGHGWVLSALHQQTEVGLSWSLIGSAIFLTYLSTFLAFPAACCKWLLDQASVPAVNAHMPWGAFLLWPVTLAVAWTGSEALRGMWFSGFDSLAAGYLFSSWPLRGWVPVLGIYGCSLLFYSGSAISGAAWIAGRASFIKRTTVGVASLVFVLAGGAILDTKHWVEPAGEPLSFRLIQGGVPQKLKFEARERERQIVAYTDTITAAPADLIVTPETAFPVGLTELDPAVLARLRSFSIATGSNIFLGAPHLDVQGRVKNSVFQVAPEASQLPRYDKARLMPFGEYAPPGFAWFTQRMSVALNDQTPGPSHQAPFELRTQNTKIRIGVLVCHEDLSYSDARRWASQSGLLINPGNLAWFEGSLALPQRLQIARIRALETGRPLLRTTNTGVTAHLDAKGSVVAHLTSDVTGVLAGSIQPTAGLTPFARFGNLLAVGLAGAFLLVALIASKPMRS